MITVNEAVEQARKVYTVTVAVSRLPRGNGPLAVYMAHEMERAEEDAHRTIARELALSSPEINARFKASWSDLYTTEVDDNGRPVPVEEARMVLRRLTFTPRAKPFPSAVYALRRPLAEGASLHDAAEAGIRELSLVPHYIRLHPRRFVDYVNGLQQYGFGEVLCDGVPVEQFVGVAEDEVALIFPLPKEA